MSARDFRVVVSEWLTNPPPPALARDVDLPTDPKVVICVVGPRRAGKTSLLYRTIAKVEDAGVPRQNVLYVDFEHPALAEVSALDLEEMLKAFHELSRPDPRFPLYLFLDEIQKVKDYGKWFRRRLDARYYISGSTSRLTSKSVADELRGRSVDHVVLPLSFGEYLRFTGVEAADLEALRYSEKRGAVLSSLRQFLRLGGYPAVALERDERERVRLLRAYFDSVVVRDLAAPDASLAQAVGRFIVSNYAGMLSVNRVHDYVKSLGFKVGKEKVTAVLRKGEESFAFFPVELFVRSERRRKSNVRKVYLVDTGYPAALGYDFSIGRAMENAVLLELRRRGAEVYYWKEYGKSDGAEVDFVVSKNFEALELMQVTFAEGPPTGRELRGLEKAAAELRPPKKTVVTWDYSATEGEVEFVPLWYWLLKKS